MSLTPRVDAIESNAVRNVIINGNFDLWQRGTSFTSDVSGQYTADRWHEFKNASAFAGSVSRQLDTPLNDGFQEFTLEVRRDNGNDNTAGHFLTYTMESKDAAPLRGRRVMLSFSARSGADYSPVNENLKVQIFSGTGTDEGPLPGPFTTGNVTLHDDNVQLQNAQFTRFNIFVDVPVNSNQLKIRFIAEHTGTAGANDVYRIGKVMLTAVPDDFDETIDVPFQRAGRTIGEELAMAQRYYERFTRNSSEPLAHVQDTFSVSPHGAGNAVYPIFWRQVKRAIPTINVSGTFDANNGAVTASATFSSAQATESGAQMTFSSSTTQGSPARLFFDSDSSFIEVDAEL